MALLITSTSTTAIVTVTKTLYDIILSTTLSTVISPSLTTNIANATPIFPVNGATSTFSSCVPPTNNSSNITTLTNTITHNNSNIWWKLLLALPIAVFLCIIWITILFMFSESKSPWMYFLRYGLNAQIRAEEEKESEERERRQAEIDEREKEWEAAHNERLERFDQSMADFTRIVRFRGRAVNYSSKDDKLYIEDDYARFKATDEKIKLTDLEIFKILILEYEKKYDTEVQWQVKHPVEYAKSVKEFGHRVSEMLEEEKRMRTKRNDPVADERDRVEICETFGWDPADPFFKLP